MKTLILGLILSAAAFAADAVGKWTGTVSVSREGEVREQEALFIFKMADGKLTGSAGPDEDRQVPFQNVRQDGAKITFEVREGDTAVNGAVTVDGDSMKGEIKGEADGRKMSATFDLKRSK